MARSSRGRLLGLSLLGVAGVLLQCIQTEDPRPALAYYTVISALVLAAASALSGAGVPGMRGPLVAGSAAVVVSAVVFWTAIAPVNGLGQTWAALAATFTLHTVLPGWLLVNRRVIGVCRRPGPWGVVEVEALPFAYLVGLLVARSESHPPPYVFLDPSQVGWVLVSLSVVGLAVIHLVAARLLWPTVRSDARVSDTDTA